MSSGTISAMTKKERDAWWRDIESISDADLQIGYRVKPRQPLPKDGKRTSANGGARKRGAVRGRRSARRA